MLRHYVFLDILTASNNVELVEKSLAELSKKIKGCGKFEFGKCADSTRHYFFMDFIDESSRNAYLAHPEHVKVASEIIIPRLENGLKSVTVFDYLRSGKPTISNMEKGLTGYILVKMGEETEVLEELQKHCDKINHLKPLQNCSVEELGKDYAYALKVVLSEGPTLPKFGKGTPFWTENSSKVPLENKTAHAHPLQNEISIKSKL